MNGYRWNAKSIDSRAIEEQEAESDMDPRSFIMGNGCPGFSFVRPGDRIVGQIISEPKLQQMKVWRNGQPTDELAVWPSGDPKLQLAFQVQTQFRNYEGIRDPKRESPDDGRRTVYVNGKHRESALRRAIQAAGAEWLEVGGWYDEIYTGDDYESKAGIKPKLAEIRYAPPSAAYRAQQAQTADQAYMADQERIYAAQAQVNAERQVAQQQASGGQQQGWQQPGWTPVMPPAPPAMPSHHGSPADIPTWASSQAPVSTPPVQSAPPAQSAKPMSTLEQLRAANQSASFTDEPPY